MLALVGITLLVGVEGPPPVRPLPFSCSSLEQDLSRDWADPRFQAYLAEFRASYRRYKARIAAKPVRNPDPSTLRDMPIEPKG